MNYRKKPVVIQATQWFKDGDHPAVIRKTASDRYADEGVPWVPTLEGGHIVTPGDWIITGVKGEHYPCKPEIFEMTYEAAAPLPQPEPVNALLVDALERMVESVTGVNQVSAVNEARAALTAAKQAQPEREMQKLFLTAGLFPDACKFDADGSPSFYTKESADKFAAGKLDVPCKGKNCGSLNGWLHSAECRAEHEAACSEQAQSERAPLTDAEIEQILDPLSRRARRRYGLLRVC